MKCNTICKSSFHIKRTHFCSNLISQLFPELADEDLGEDDVFVLESIAEAKKNEEDKLRVTLILSLKDSMPALTKVLKIIEVSSTYACTLQLLLGFHKVVCMGGIPKTFGNKLVLALGKVWKKCSFFQLLYTSIIRNKNRAFCWNNRRVILIIK